LRALPGLFNYADGDGVELEGAGSVPLRAFNPTDCVRVGGCEELAAGDAAEVVGEDVMVTNAAFDAVNAVKQLDQFKGFDDEAGLFAHLANDAGGERLADFKQAAGQRPLALERLVAAADEQDAACVYDYGTDADKRRFWILSLHGPPLAAMPGRTVVLGSIGRNRAKVGT
jgi:hypothetical protein